MDKQRVLHLFNDILEPRRNEFSNFLWVSRKLDTALAYKQTVKQIPAAHKKAVLSSYQIQGLIQKISDQTGVPKLDVENAVNLILDEIGFSKQLKLIRWLGLVLTKICQKVYTGIRVNEASVQRLKAAMGNCPVIFAPSHRSYADFILMSYVLFNYDIEIPSIASGMDFHAMWGMGNMLRNTGAFFMRRSFNDDNLYWATFRQYVHQLVTGGDLPIEFFIEGTRSRSCKALSPKYGLLSMMLKPLFTGEVPDVLIVPINISYDRVLEEKLFAFELLGVPKPKESTSGFFKSLSIVKENYGNIYVDFTTPISAREHFGAELDRARHALKPVHLQTLDARDKELVNDIAYDIVHTQQKHAVLTVFNVTAVLVNHNLVTLRKAPFTMNELSVELAWFTDVLHCLGARMETLSDASLDKALLVHRNLVHVSRTSGHVHLVHPPVVLNEADRKKSKGYQLHGNTMTAVVPVFMLQLYVNPCLHYLVDCGLVTMVTASHHHDARTLTKERQRWTAEPGGTVYTVFEKVVEFEDALNKLQQLKVIELTADGYVVLAGNERLQTLLIHVLNPFITAYCYVCRILRNVPVSTSVEHNYVLVEAQRQLERTLCQMDVSIHPYCLSLDTLGICLQQLVSLGVVQKYTENSLPKYKIIGDKLNVISERLEHFSSKCLSKTSSPTSAEIYPAKL